MPAAAESNAMEQQKLSSTELTVISSTSVEHGSLDDHGDGVLASGEVSNVCRLSEVKTELKHVCRLGLSVVVNFLCQMALGLQCVMFLGHLGELELAGGGMGAFTVNVTGFSVLVGLSSGVETLGAQAFGAHNFPMCGTILQRAIVISTIACIPICVLWWFLPQFLVLVGVNEDIAGLAGIYARWVSLGLWPFGVFQMVQKYMQTQGQMWCVTWASALTNIQHAITLYLLIFVADLGFHGAAIAMAITNWVLLGILLAWIKYFRLHEKTWFGWGRECFSGLGPYLRLAVPGSAMLCLEWWGFEFVTLMAARMGQTESATQTVLFNILTVTFMVPLGCSVAASTRVGNALGAGNGMAAKRTALVSLGVIAAVTTGSGVILITTSQHLGKAFTESAKVVEMVASIVPIMSAFVVCDGLQGVASGILRGCGRQSIGAGLNLMAYWVLALPLAVTCGFVLHMGVIGLWYGLFAGVGIQCIALNALVLTTNWTKTAAAARARANEEHVETKASKEVELDKMSATDSQADEEDGNLRMLDNC